MKSLILVFMLLTMIVLTIGLLFMARGGKLNQKYSNKLMFLRVAFQGITIALIGLIYLVTSG